MCFTTLPRIEWGNSLDNVIEFSYPLYNWITRTEAQEGSQFLQIESGYEDAWIVNASYILEADARWIPTDQWDGELGWGAFLEWAASKNAFTFYPDTESDNSVSAYLIEPLTQSPTLEPDGTQTIRLIMRNYTTPFELISV